MTELIPVNQALKELDGAFPAGEELRSAGAVELSGIVREGYTGKFCTVMLRVNGESLYCGRQALEDLAAMAGVPLDFVAQLPDELIRANLEWALGKLRKQRGELAVVVASGEVVAWARPGWRYPRPSELLGELEERLNVSGLAFLGKPACLARRQIRYRLTTAEMTEVFEESPVANDRHQFAVQLHVDHLGWRPVQVEAFGLRLVCENGLMAPIGRGQSERIWPVIKDFEDRLMLAVRRGFDFLAKTLIPRLRESIRRPVPEGARRIEGLLAAAPREVRRGSLDMWDRLAYLGDTEYRLINALTAAANLPEVPTEWHERLARLGGEVAAGALCPTCLRRM